MPFPILIPIAAALLAGSVAAQNAAAKKSAKARSRALEADLIRNRQLRDEQYSLNEKARQGFDNVQGQMDQKASTLAGLYETAAREALPAAPVMPDTTSSITVQEQNKQNTKAKAFTDQQAAARAELRSFGDVLGDANMNLGRQASLVNQLQGFQRGNSAVLPLELQAAALKGSGLRQLGDLLRGAGTIALSAGLAGAMAPTAAGAAGSSAQASYAAGSTGPGLGGIY